MKSMIVTIGDDLVERLEDYAREIAPLEIKGVDLADLVRQLEDFMLETDGAYSRNTELGYRADMRVFARWCIGHRRWPLPASPETVAEYIRASAERHKIATLRRRVAAISFWHRALEHREASKPDGAPTLADPTKHRQVSSALRKAARAQQRPRRQAKGLTEEQEARILAVVGPQPENLLTLRDVALMLVARDMLGRASEVLSLEVEDLIFMPEGPGLARIRRSKTDQEGQGVQCFLSRRTVAYLRQWLARAGILSGPVFQAVRGSCVIRRGRGMRYENAGQTLKRLLALADYSPDGFSGHSCRVGMAQDLLAFGVELGEIMRAGRWASPEMVARYTEHLTAARGGVARYRNGRS